MTVKEEWDQVVIGAGPAGLTAAYQLSKFGKRVLVVESSQYVGGFSRTETILDAKVDLGPHRFFSDDHRVNSIWIEIMQSDYVMIDRQTRILYGGDLYDYPLKPANALAKMGAGTAALCLLSYVRARALPPNDQSTFEGWVTARFGTKLYKMFFQTYSERLWGIPCDQLDSDFAAQRIKKFSLGAAVKSALIPGSGKGHKTLADCFAYPIAGTGEVYERMTHEIRRLGGEVRLGTPVRRVMIEDQRATGVELCSGEIISARGVISTMPLTLMANGLPHRPQVVDQALAKLRYRNTQLVYLKINAPSDFSDQWVYVHDERIKMGRLTNFSNWSHEIGGDRATTILCVEYWSDDGDDQWIKSDQELIDIATRDVLLTGLVKTGQVIGGEIRRLHRCYPIYDRGYRGQLATVTQFLDLFENLTCIGRYGSFKYNNQDHSILMGLLASENIALGKEHDLWGVNTDYDSYQEKSLIDESGLNIK